MVHSWYNVYSSLLANLFNLCKSSFLSATTPLSLHFTMSQTLGEFCILRHIGDSKVSSNGQVYYKLRFSFQLGYSATLITMSYFRDVAPDIPLNSKVQVKRNGSILKYIEMSDFEECTTCLRAVPSLFDAMECTHGDAPVQKYVTGELELLSAEEKSYTHSVGLKLTFKVGDQQKYAVIFENSHLFEVAKKYVWGKSMYVEGWYSSEVGNKKDLLYVYHIGESMH